MLGKTAAYQLLELITQAKTINEFKNQHSKLVSNPYVFGDNFFKVEVRKKIKRNQVQIDLDREWNF